ncbi:hypothetical protein NDU88_003170 [Pleurodeles waltl]|uniref:Uncharacterized protein n=1 Tax=Pleurodeles waltl TaxID=8319 RepID=A0AAV7UZU4_PLEWA|nr:hypothetical protein NDU88_003170 [Pleurodeles waltl]
MRATVHRLRAGRGRSAAPSALRRAWALSDFQVLLTPSQPSLGPRSRTRLGSATTRNAPHRGEHLRSRLPSDTAASISDGSSGRSGGPKRPSVNPLGTIRKGPRLHPRATSSPLPLRLRLFNGHRVWEFSALVPGIHRSIRRGQLQGLGRRPQQSGAPPGRPAGPDRHGAHPPGWGVSLAPRPPQQAEERQQGLQGSERPRAPTLVQRSARSGKVRGSR